MHPAILVRDREECIPDGVRDHDPSQRQVAAGDPFGEGEDVRLHPPPHEGKPASGSTEAGDDLVGDEEDVVL